MSTAEITYHTNLHNTSCIRKAAGHLVGGGGGVCVPPCTLPADAPLNLKIDYLMLL